MTKTEQIINAISEKGTATLADLASLNIKPATLRSVLNVQVKKGRLARVSKGTYTTNTTSTNPQNATTEGGA